MRLGLTAVIVAAVCLVSLQAVVLAAEGKQPPVPRGDNPVPAFPEAARAKVVEGKVTFRADISEDGKPANIEILKTPEAGLGFEDAVREAVSRWRFEPARDGDKAVAAPYEGHIDFRLDVPYHDARMYAKRSAEVWSVASALVKELGLRVEKRNEKVQAVRTAPQWPKSEWNVPDLNHEGYRLNQIQLQIFVSPYAEPARVHVSSFATFRRATFQSTDRGDRRIWDLPALQSWFFDRMEAKLGLRGSAIPQSLERREALARELLGDAPDRCLGKRDAKCEGRPVRDFSLLPGVGYEAGRVRFELMLLEDGSVFPLRIVDQEGRTVVIEELRLGLQASRFLIFPPADPDRCMAPTTMKYGLAVNWR